MSQRSERVASVLIPIPFLLVTAMCAAGIWQNDADFILGRVQAVDAVLVDAGPRRPGGGGTRYLPTFRLPDARSLTLTRDLVASELPPAGEAVKLLCSTRIPTNCKTPRSESGILFYSLSAVWSVFSIGIAMLMWIPLHRGGGKPRRR